MSDTVLQKINVGEAEPRQIISGLRKYIPMTEMENRLLIVVVSYFSHSLKLSDPLSHLCSVT